jgi:hypothetical protein
MYSFCLPLLWFICILFSLCSALVLMHFSSWLLCDISPHFVAKAFPVLPQARSNAVLISRFHTHILLDRWGRRMRWTGHISRVENECRTLVGETEGKRSLGISRRRW